MEKHFHANWIFLPERKKEEQKNRKSVRLSGVKSRGGAKKRKINNELDGNFLFIKFTVLSESSSVESEGEKKNYSTLQQFHLLPSMIYFFLVPPLQDRHTCSPKCVTCKVRSERTSKQKKKFNRKNFNFSIFCSFPNP